jgi:hypothetical protein
MEATGTYNLAVTYYLHEQGGEVAVLNPLVIKHFIQMHLSKGKSDRKVVLSLSWLFLLSYPFCVSPKFMNVRLLSLSLGLGTPSKNPRTAPTASDSMS